MSLVVWSVRRSAMERKITAAGSLKVKGYEIVNSLGSQKVFW